MTATACSTTCDPEYYKWGQWMFLKMWEKGLAYRSTSPVNWCPVLQHRPGQRAGRRGPLLALRLGAVEKRDLTQWYFKITDYAQELLDDLDKLTGWPERVKAAAGATGSAAPRAPRSDFRPVPPRTASRPPTRKITVFTTRADTLFGVSFFLLAARVARLPLELVAGTEHEQAFMELKAATEKVSAVERAQGSEREKHGVFTGRYAINPINGRSGPHLGRRLRPHATTAPAPSWRVPCGDQRDFDFATQVRPRPSSPIILREGRPALRAARRTSRSLKVTVRRLGPRHGGRGLSWCSPASTPA